ncbi:hypothetical protein H9P43_009187 [Blastocladiella emersonii ATCC 22665]|nr:hypothetical protein H9P43_009187 [Blastocladiella emersonii ATCC 22665]
MEASTVTVPSDLPRHSSEITAAHGATPPTMASSVKAALFASKLNVLLVFVPIGIIAGELHWNDVLVFWLNFVAIIPLAKLLSFATEELAMYTNQTIGGLLNASFGNATELLMSVIALTKGLVHVVQASLLGSILSNLLLVLGASFLAGGMKYTEQTFNATAANTSASLLSIAVMALLIPAAFVGAAKTDLKETEGRVLALSHFTAIILLVVYFLYLYFQLSTHSHLYDEKASRDPNAPETEDDEEAEVPVLTSVFAGVLLLLSTVCVALNSEFLVGSIEGVSKQWGMSETFVGLILLPLVGNAAEHVSAVTFAMKNKMDLALGIAVGSSMQIALLVTPLLVVVGWIVNQPMTLFFELFDTAILFVSVLSVNYIIQESKLPATPSASSDEALAVDSSTPAAAPLAAGVPDGTNDVSPFPWKGVLCLSMVMFTNAFLFLTILPFMTWMVEDFKVTDDKNQVGTYSGWLTACMMIGGTISSYPWGMVSDAYGRKPVLMFGLFSASIALILFGFSSTFTEAIIWRTVSGLMNGVVGTAKAQMAEVCDKHHLARGFAVMSVAWGIGVVFGPIAGGFLARPAVLYPSLFSEGSFFAKWAYAPPALFGALVGFVVVAAVWFYLPETRQNVRPIPGFTWLQENVRRHEPVAAKKQDDGSHDSMVELTDAGAATTAAKTSESERSLTLWELCRDRPILITALLYGCTAAVEISFVESQVLWSRLPREEGGLALDSSDIGVVTSSNGAVTLVYQLFVYPWLITKVPLLTMFRIGTALPLVAHQLFPRVPEILGVGVSKGVGMGALIVLQAISGIGSATAFTTIFVLVSNSALDKDKGSSNGLGQTVASFARIIFPILSGNLFSLSLYNEGEPFDYHLMFYLINFMTLATLAVTLLLDLTINLPRAEADAHYNAKRGEVVVA